MSKWRPELSKTNNRGRVQIQFRCAGADEASAIAKVLFESFVEFRALYTDGGFAATTPTAEQILIRLQEGPVWLALQGEEVVGTVAAIAKGESVYIRGMAVLPSARGLGAAGGLLRKAEEWARSQNLKRVFLSTTPFLASAIRLYERSGYRITEDGAHELFGTPLLTMEKTLPS